MDEEFNLGPYLFDFYSKTDEFDRSLKEYNEASKTYKKVFNEFLNGEASAKEVRAEMRNVAFADQRLIGKGLYLKKHVEEVYSEFPEFEIEDVVSACTEETLAKEALEDFKSGYSSSERDFLDSIRSVGNDSRAVLEPEDKMVTETEVQEAIEYNWRDAFSDIRFLEASESEIGENVLGLEEMSLEKKREEVRGMEPRYIH